MAMQVRLEQVASLFSEGFEEDRPDLQLFRQAEKRAQRRALLHEAPTRRLSRLLQVMSRALHPACLATLAPAFDLIWREKTIGAIGLPDPETALARPDGLVGLAQDLSPQTLMQAYATGLQPRCLIGPATYWAPASRLVLHPANLHWDDGLRALQHKGEYTVNFDRDFETLVEACAQASASQSRLNPKLLKAHVDLFDAGNAHSFEVHDRSGKLVGGGYGIAVGRNFVLERWFSLQTNAARFGLLILARHLAQWGYRMMDATIAAELVQGMGFEPMDRRNYNLAIDLNASGGRAGHWRADPAIYAPRSASTAVRHLFDQPRATTPIAPEILAQTQTDLFASLGMVVPQAPATAKATGRREKTTRAA